MIKSRWFYIVLLCVFALSAGIFACGSSSDSPPVTDPFEMNPPLNITADVINSTTVDISWIDNSVGETGYEVNHLYCQGLGGPTCLSCSTNGLTAQPANTNSYSYTNLTPLSDNGVTVKVYENTWGSYEVLKYFITPLDTPVITLASAIGNTVTINWSYNFLACQTTDAYEGYVLEESPTAPDSGYSVIYNTIDQTPTGDNSTSVSVDFANRISGMTYYYRVYAQDVGYSYTTPYSDVAIVNVP